MAGYAWTIVLLFRLDVKEEEEEEVASEGLIDD